MKKQNNIKAFLIGFALILSSCMENDIQPANLPELNTLEITGISYTVATCKGTLKHNGGAQIIECGFVYSTMGTPDLENNEGKTTDPLVAGSISHDFSDLTRETTYNIRTYARNEVGVAYGEVKTFFTVPAPVIPQLTTADISAITQTSAVSGGNITDNGRAEITQCGIVYNTSPNPDVANNKGRLTSTLTDGYFSCTINNLAPATTYYIRAYAVNSAGVGYGEEKEFITENIPTVTDFDGNVYNVVKIGNQSWMAADLKVTHYNDGTSIRNVTSDTDWAALGDNNTDAAYCIPAATEPAFGALYTWASAANPKICPEGWHVATDNDWKELEAYLGIDAASLDLTGWRGTNEGSKLAGFADCWAADILRNDPGFGTSGFNAIGEGYRNPTTGVFSGLRLEGRWWSGSPEASATTGWRRRLASNNNKLARVADPKSSGCSIRCVKNR